MKPTTLLSKPYYWSSQLRLNALWSVWLSYVFGVVILKGSITQSFVYDLVALAALSIISALWNDWSDQDVDSANNRRHAWHSISLPVRKGLLVLSGILLVCTATFNVYRLLWILAVLVLGYLYNSAAWSRRPLHSLVLYALYYRMAPLVLALLSHGGSISWSLYLYMVCATGLIKVGSGMYKDIKDRVGDAQHGKKTMVLALGLI